MSQPIPETVYVVEIVHGHEPEVSGVYRYHRDAMELCEQHHREANEFREHVDPLNWKIKGPGAFEASDSAQAYGYYVTPWEVQP